MTNKESNDLSVHLASIEASTKSAHKRIDELQVVIKAFYELAADVKVMVNEMTNMKADINDIKIKVNVQENEPNKLLFNVKSSIITAIIGSIVGAIIALIIK